MSIQQIGCALLKFSYLEPIRLPFAFLCKKISGVFERSIPEPDPSLLVHEKGIEDGYVWPGGFTEYLDQASHPYETAEVPLYDGRKLKVAKTWMSDIERIGNPDKFFINQTPIANLPTELGDKQKILEILMDLAQNDSDTVRQWTEIWSYRTKISLINDLMYDFKARYKLNPILARNGFEEAVTALNTEESQLTCYVKGTISNATDDNCDLVDVAVCYKANMIYDISKKELNRRITLWDKGL